jgi:predicted small lipoprotein YifL
MRGKVLNALLAAATAVTLSACGGGGGNDAPPAVAVADTTVGMSPTVAGAVVSTAFSFPLGVASFGTTSATTVTFNDTTPIPAFTVMSGGNTAIGATTFGSCIFKIASSDFPASSPLGEGKTITVNPCNININTRGQVANGVGQPRSVALVLGAAASSGTSIIVSVTPSGQVTLNGATVGTVVLSDGTGATGGS